MRFKKVWSAMLALCVICSSAVNVFAVAEHDTEDVKINYDFESSLEFTASCARRTDTGDIYHNNVMEVFPTEALSSSFKKLPGLEDEEKTTMSFDFYALQTDHIFRMALHDGEKVYSSVYWDHGGRVVFSLNGYEPAGVSKTDKYAQQATASYETGKWHNISMVINPAGVNTTIDYYYDGAFMGTCETNRSQTGKLDTLYFTSTFSGYNISSTEALDYDGSERLYIDNIRISQGTDDFYAVAEENDGYVTLKLSQQLAAKSITDGIALINTATEEEVAIKKIINEGTKLYIIPDENLKAGKEYIIKLPATLVSVMGKALCNDIVYFTSVYGEDNASWEMAEPYVFNADFENLLPGAAVKNDEEWNKVIAASTINGVSCVEEDGNKFVRFTNEAGATYLRFESSGKWTDDSARDRVIVQMEVSLPGIKRSPDILVLVSSKTVGQCFFDSCGRFVMTKDGSFDSSEDTDGEYPENHIVYELSAVADKWYMLSLCIDKAAKTIDYYVDGEFAGQTSWSENISNPRLSAIRVKANSELADSRAIDFDNLKIAHTASTESVSKLRLISRDSQSWGPAAKDVISTVSDGRLEFSCDIDFASVQDEDIVISDGTDDVTVSVTGCGSNYVTFSLDSFLKAGTGYTITVSGISSSDLIPMAPYKAGFATSSKTSVEIDGFRMENAAGERIISISDISAGDVITLKTDIINSTEDDVIVRPVMTVENDNILTASAENEFNAVSGKVTPVSVSITVQNRTNTAVSAMLADESYAPVCDAIVYSDMAEPVEDEWTVIYSGRLDSAKADERIFADVLLPGKARGDITSSVPLSTVLAYRTQTVTDDEGEFTLKFRLRDDSELDGDAVSGEYTVLMSYKGDTKKDKISFSNVNEAAGLTAEINRAAENENAVSLITGIITANPDALGIDAAQLKQIDAEQLAVMVYNNIKNEGAFADESGVKSFLDKCMAIRLTADSGISNLFVYERELMLSQSKIKNLYTMEFVTEELEKEITSELFGKKIDSTEAFYDILTEIFVLNTVEHPDGYNNIRTVINELCSEIGLDEEAVQDASDEVYSRLAYKSFESYEELEAAFEDALSDEEKSSSGSNRGNGGGGGGSSSGSIKYSNTVQAAPTPPVTPIPENIFDDLDGAKWAMTAIISLAEKKIISGKGENKFCPNDNITREEFTKLIVSAFLTDAEEADISFADVDESRWSYSYIRKAYGADVISGKSNDYFGANENITRQDMASILYRAAVKKGITFTNGITRRFADEAEIPGYAVEAVNMLYNANVISGMSEGNFEGAGFATRAQAAKMIDELLKL